MAQFTGEELAVRRGTGISLVDAVSHAVNNAHRHPAPATWHLRHTEPKISDTAEHGQAIWLCRSAADHTKFTRHATGTLTFGHQAQRVTAAITNASKPVAGLIILGLAILPLASCGADSAATAAAGPFAYAVNTKSNEISQYSAPPRNSGALKPLAPATVPTGSFPYGVAIDPKGSSVYVADANANEVSQYTINPMTGQLTPKTPATVAAGRGSVEVAVTPNGKSAYVVDDNAVSQYSINPTTGKLIPKSPATVATGRNAEAIAISPNGKYVYVSNCPGCSVKPRGSHSVRPSKPPTATIWEYRINQHTGELSRVGTVATGTGANAIAITPNGRSLYVAVAAVWQYSIDPVTGKLTPKSPATVAAPGTAHDIAIAPDGKNAYIITVANNTVSQYRIDPRTGALNSKPVSTAHTVRHPEALKLAPNGKAAYVTSENDGELSQYTIDPTTGKITPKSPGTVPTASGSLGLAITPGP